MKQSQRKLRKYEKHEKEKSLLYYYDGESSKNSVCCGDAGVEFALELCVGSSEAAWYALAKREKVSCEVVQSYYKRYSYISWSADKAPRVMPLEPSRNLEN